MYCVLCTALCAVLCTVYPAAPGPLYCDECSSNPNGHLSNVRKRKNKQLHAPPPSRSSLQVVGAPPCSPSRRPLALPSAGVPPGLRSPGIHCGGGTQHHHERLARAMRRTCYAIQPVPASGLQPTSSQSGMSILLLFPAPLRSYDRPLFSSCPITAPSPTLFALRPGSKVYCAPP